MHGLPRFHLNTRQLITVVIIVALMDSTDCQSPDCTTCADGNAPPYHITQPSTNDYVQIISPEAAALTLMCSLNVTIPSGMTITWLHNGRVVSTITTRVDQTSKTVSLLRGRPEPSDAGVYQCVFNDTAGYVLRRNITLLITVPKIIQPPADFHRVVFDESAGSVQLRCSLNVTIPSSVTVTWTHNNNAVIATPSNEIMQTDNTATLLINNPQPSDVGNYQCVFDGLNLQRIIILEFQNSTIISTHTFPSATVTVSTNVASVNPRAHNITQSVSHSATSVITTDTSMHIITDSTRIVTTASPDLNLTPTTTTTITTSASINATISNSPVLKSSQSDKSSINVKVIVVTVVLLAVVFIAIITVIVVGIIVAYCKNKRYIKPEGADYSTIGRKAFPTSKTEAVYFELERQDTHYINIEDIVHSNEQADKIMIDDIYSVPYDNKVKTQDNPAYSTSFCHT